MALTLGDGRYTISRDRPLIRIGCMRPNQAAGSDKSCSVPTTAARHGSRWATSSRTMVYRARTNGMTARHTLGSLSGSGISNHRSPIQTHSTLGLKTPLCSTRLTAEKLGWNFPVYAATALGRAGNQVPVGCVYTQSFWIQVTPGGSSSPFRLGSCPPQRKRSGRSASFGCSGDVRFNPTNGRRRRDWLCPKSANNGPGK